MTLTCVRCGKQGEAPPASADSDPSVLTAETLPLASRSLILDITSGDGRAIAVGERGHILVSESRSDWRQVEGVPTRSTLTAVTTVGEHAWAVGHDGVIGDYAGLMPGAVTSGDTVIGEGCLVGTNATVIEGLTLGPWAKLGAGTVAIADVDPDATVVGVPARPITPAGSSFRARR